MYTFLKSPVGIGTMLFVLILVLRSVLPAQTPEQRLASDKQLCQHQAGINLDTIGDVSMYPSGAQYAEMMERIPKMAAYAKCMQNMGYSLR